MGRRWHLIHGEGSEWTGDELEAILRDERRHDRQWPYDANLLAVTVDREGSGVYLIDNCQTWHWLPETDDMVVVWDG